MNRQVLLPENRETHIPRECREEFIPIDFPGAGLLEQWGIGLAGISDLTQGYHMNRRNCPFTVLICVLEGKGTCRYGGADHPLAKGDILIKGAGTDHLYWSEGEWRILWFHLDPSRWGSAVNPFFIKRREEMGKSLNRTALTYLRECQGPGDESVLLSAGELLHAMIVRVLALSGAPSEQRYERIIGTLRKEINRDIRRDWTVEELADRVNITPSYLYKITGRVLDETPQGIVRQMKMELAVQLLRHSDYPLKFIAERIGYSTAYAFSKAFKREYGISPGRFRNGENVNTERILFTAPCK